MRMYNKLKINAEDYSEDNQEDIAKLADIYNPFVDELENIINGNIDFENLNQKVFTIDVTVDSSGIPLQGGKFNLSNNNQPKGFLVINAKNLTSNSVFPDSCPFIIFTPTGTGIIQINKITGLPANNKYRLTVISY